MANDKLEDLSKSGGSAISTIGKKPNEEASPSRAGMECTMSDTTSNMSVAGMLAAPPHVMSDQLTKGDNAKLYQVMSSAYGSLQMAPSLKAVLSLIFYNEGGNKDDQRSKYITSMTDLNEFR